MTLGQRISLHRKKLNISQEELGARLGVSRQAVSKWETDLSAPDLNNLIGLARELGVSLAELTETPEEPVPPKNAGKKWWFLLSVCVLLPVLLAGCPLDRINRPAWGAGKRLCLARVGLLPAMAGSPDGQPGMV